MQLKIKVNVVLTLWLLLSIDDATFCEKKTLFLQEKIKFDWSIDFPVFFASNSFFFKKLKGIFESFKENMFCRKTLHLIPLKVQKKFCGPRHIITTIPDNSMKMILLDKCQPEWNA